MTLRRAATLVQHRAARERLTNRRHRAGGLAELAIRIPHNHHIVALTIQRERQPDLARAIRRGGKRRRRRQSGNIVGVEHHPHPFGMVHERVAVALVIRINQVVAPDFVIVHGVQLVPSHQGIKLAVPGAGCRQRIRQLQVADPVRPVVAHRHVEHRARHIALAGIGRLKGCRVVGIGVR